MSKISADNHKRHYKIASLSLLYPVCIPKVFTQILMRMVLSFTFYFKEKQRQKFSKVLSLHHGANNFFKR